jgi:hypothetical protein
MRSRCLGAFSVSENFAEANYFTSPYKMVLHGDVDNGTHLSDGHIPHDELFSVLSEVVARFTYLYAYGTSICSFLTDLLCRTAINLQESGFPPPAHFRHKFKCSMSCHKFRNIRCATKQPRSFYDCHLYHVRLNRLSGAPRT